MAGMDALVPRRRWFWPTPAWLVYGAAAATGVLFASERWRWFPVHYQKGWPVLLAVAVVGAVLVLIPAWLLAALLFWRRVQFGLRTLLVFVTLCAVVCSWFSVRLREARRQAIAVKAVGEKLGGVVNYDWEYDNDGNLLTNAIAPGPERLRGLLSVDFFADVEGLFVFFPDVPDAGLPDIESLTRLRYLRLGYDRFPKQIELDGVGLIDLRHLDPGEPDVTDEGLKKLHRAFPECQIYVHDHRRY